MQHHLCKEGSVPIVNVCKFCLGCTPERQWGHRRCPLCYELVFFMLIRSPNAPSGRCAACRSVLCFAIQMTRCPPPQAMIPPPGPQATMPPPRPQAMLPRPAFQMTRCPPPPQPQVMMTRLRPQVMSKFTQTSLDEAVQNTSVAQNAIGDQCTSRCQTCGFVTRIVTRGRARFDGAFKRSVMKGGPAAIKARKERAARRRCSE